MGEEHKPVANAAQRGAATHSKKKGQTFLIGGIANGSVRWQELGSIDYEVLGCLLSCHLIIEHYLDHYIAQYANVPFDWESARLTFRQKVSLVSKIPGFNERYNLSPTILHLNSLRNRFAHNLNTKLTEEDLLPFRQFFANGSRADARLPKDALGLLQLFTSIVAAYLGGYVAGLVGVDKTTAPYKHACGKGP